jgi:acyl-CoA reductase-like NAD-dependent aldehyde dehydrogenase
MQTEEIARIVAEVLKKLDNAEGIASAPSAKPCPSSAGGSGACDVLHGSVDAAVQTAKRAQELFQEQGLELRREVIRAMRKAAIANAEAWAKLAREETGMGRWEDKVQKNLVCATRTPGVEDLVSRSFTGDKGLTLVEYAPYGVVAAITPSTNPAATIINNAISIIAAGNSVVFSPHPASFKTTLAAMRALSQAAVAAGAPRWLITTYDKPSQENTKALLAHPDAKVNMVTGGPAIVKVAMTVGKTCKTIAAGPGNPPVVVDETAVFPKCAEDVIFGASFDNNVLCTAEKEVIVTQAAAPKFLAAMRADRRAFELTPQQCEQLTKLVIKEGGKGCKDPVLNRDYVGKDASVIAAGIGLSIPAEARLLWAEVPNDHALVWTEQLMPFLPVTVVRDVDAAIDLAVQAEGGHRHTAAMHSTNVGNLTKMARRMQCSIYVKNAPTLYGLGLGEGYATMSIGTPTGDGLTKASHFARPLHCALVGYFRIA